MTENNKIDRRSQKERDGVVCVTGGGGMRRRQGGGKGEVDRQRETKRDIYEEGQTHREAERKGGCARKTDLLHLI